MKVCDPLAARGGDVEVGHGLLDVGRNTAPEKIRVSLNEISRICIPQLAVEPVFLKLVEQGVRLLQIERIAELSYQIRRLNQSGFQVVRIVLLSIGRRKARALNRSGHPPCV